MRVLEREKGGNGVLRRGLVRGLFSVQQRKGGKRKDGVRVLKREKGEKKRCT